MLTTFFEPDGELFSGFLKAPSSVRSSWKELKGQTAALGVGGARIEAPRGTGSVETLRRLGEHDPSAEVASALRLMSDAKPGR